MMLHDILVDFPGSQDGTATEQFVAGTQRELSDYLAAIVVPCGWARPVQSAPIAESAPLIDDRAPTGLIRRKGKCDATPQVSGKEPDDGLGSPSSASGEAQASRQAILSSSVSGRNRIRKSDESSL